MTNSDMFYKQIDSFTGPVGLVYYVEHHISKWVTYEACYDATLQHMNTINDYDPMQFHGCKTDEELVKMAELASPRAFKHDQENKFNIQSVGVVAVSRGTKEDQDTCRLDTESQPQFFCWFDLDRAKELEQANNGIGEYEV
jgi:hypothetical protein